MLVGMGHMTTCNFLDTGDSGGMPTVCRLLVLPGWPTILLRNGWPDHARSGKNVVSKWPTIRRQCCLQDGRIPDELVRSCPMDRRSESTRWPAVSRGHHRAVNPG